MKSQKAGNKTIVRCVTAFAMATLLLGWLSEAEGQPYEIPRYVIAGGGGHSASGSYALHGTIGQPWVDFSASAGYGVGSGFWGGFAGLFTVAIESISYSVAQGVRITWQSVAGATYTVYYTESLPAVWQALQTLAGTGGLMDWFDNGSLTGKHPGSPGVLRRFYRLRGEP